jgi:hypothetical protein
LFLFVIKGDDNGSTRHTIRKRLLRIRRVLPVRLPRFAANDQPANNRQPNGSLQPESLPRRQSVPEYTQHMARSTGGALERADLVVPSSARLDPVAHSRLRAVLQRAGLRALAWHARRHHRIHRARRQHQAGHRQMGHARDDQEAPALLQGRRQSAFLLQAQGGQGAVRAVAARDGDASQRQADRTIDHQELRCTQSIHYNLFLNSSNFTPNRLFLFFSVI